MEGVDGEVEENEKGLVAIMSHDFRASLFFSPFWALCKSATEREPV